MILIGPFKKTTNCDRHVASKPNKRSEINIQICAKFMIEGNIKYMLDSIYDNGNESTQIKNIKVFFQVFFQVFFKCFSSIIINRLLVNDGSNSTVQIYSKFIRNTLQKICTVEFKPSFTSKLFIIILEKHLRNT